jgi:hypothetical protein
LLICWAKSPKTKLNKIILRTYFHYCVIRSSLFGMLPTILCLKFSLKYRPKSAKYASLDSKRFIIPKIQLEGFCVCC